MSITQVSKELLKQQGVSLIEVLVALLVLSIGLVGLAGLQSVGLKSNSSAEVRTQATILAYDMIDSMRANRDTAINTSCYLLSMGGTVPSSCNSLATNDLTAWKANLAASLPSGNGSVSNDDTGTRRVITVTVQWDDTRAGGTATQQLSIDTEL